MTENMAENEGGKKCSDFMCVISLLCACKAL